MSEEELKKLKKYYSETKPEDRPTDFKLDYKLRRNYLKKPPKKSKTFIETVFLVSNKGHLIQKNVLIKKGFIFNLKNKIILFLNRIILKSLIQ